MAPQTLAQLHQSPAAPVLPGTWKLGAGRAITLQPPEPGVLRIAHGSVWATFDGPQRGAANDQGDYVIGAGDRMHLAAGQRVVIEAWRRESPAYFTWEPQADTAAVATARYAQVVQPWTDLQRALLLAGAAAVRLAAGLAGLGAGLASGRSRASLAECAFNAHSRA